MKRGGACEHCADLLCAVVRLLSYSIVVSSFHMSDHLEVDHRADGSSAAVGDL